MQEEDQRDDKVYDIVCKLTLFLIGRNATSSCTSQMTRTIWAHTHSAAFPRVCLFTATATAQLYVYLYNEVAVFIYLFK